MKKLLFPRITIFCIILCTASCKKYDGGPAFSLRTKKARVSNTWRLTKLLVDGTDLTNTVDNTCYNFKKDGEFILTADQDTLTLGQWYFEDNKRKISFFDNQSPTDITTVLITELKANEMKWKSFGNGVIQSADDTLQLSSTFTMVYT